VRTLVRSKDGGPKRNEWNVKITTTTTGADDSVVQYDSRGRPIRWWMHGTQTGKEPPARLVQEVVFDELGEHVARRTLPIDETVPPEGRPHEEYAYDPLGRPLSLTTPWKATTNYEYEGKSVLITDPLKQTTTEEHDALGRLVKVTDPNDGVTAYTYGPFGALWTVTDPGKAVTTTVRDAYGRVRTAIDPDKGTTILGYNGFGDLVSSLDASDRSVTFVYDALGRKTRREDQAGNGPVQVTTWTWDTAPLGTGGRLALGALAQVEAPGGMATAYTYDDLGRLVTTARTIAGELFETSATYDDLGRLSTLTYPSAPGLTPFTIKNEYDPHGHLIQVRDPANKTANQAPYWRLTGTDEADRIAAESFGNGFVTRRDYYGDRGALKSIHTARGMEPAIQELGYTYDAKQNLASRHDALQPDHATEFFKYDALDRLTCASFTDTPDCSAANLYTYAPSGNLLTKPGIPGVYTYDLDHPHAVATAGVDSFGYDLVGNQVNRTGMVVTYTAFDLPKSFTPAPGKGGVPVTLDYDGDQRRVRKTAGAEVTVYAGDLYERTTNSASGAVEHRYSIRGSERVVAVVSRGGASGSSQKTRYLHTDNLGSVETVTDETGSKPDEKRSYDAFGARRNPHWGAQPVLFSSVTTQGFTGHEDDEDLGLVNMKGRLYDPKVGRFLTPDPIVSRPRFGQSWNPYSYVLNNPLSYVDPSGFEPVVSYSPECSGCKGGTVTFGKTTVEWTYTPPTPAPPPKTPPPPKVDAAKVGLTAAPTDVKPTGGTTSPPPEATADGAGGGSPDPRLSTGGGGADSGQIVQSQLTPDDHAGFRRNVTEESHAWGMTAALAPLRYPVVVGVIAFGLFNPDPAYAPNFDTQTENRPSDLERIGETGLAVAIGAAGIKIGQLGASGETTARGGVYVLRDEAGNVVRTGRTNDLGRRKAEHGSAAATARLKFEIVKSTDDRAVQRGLEQMIHDQNKPPLDKINPISPSNPRRQGYLDAALQFLRGEK
jgi:RHS repeat-associated protein